MNKEHYQPDLFLDGPQEASKQEKKQLKEEPAPMLCCGKVVQPWAHCPCCGTRND